jgi:hypothetical protein
MGKKRCGDCERWTAEKEAERLMDSWMCFFFNDVWCPHSKVPKSLRVGSVCQACEHFARFNAEMEKDEEKFNDMVENPAKYGWGGAP